MKSERLISLIQLSTAVFLITITSLLLSCGYLEVWHTPWYEQRFASTIAIAHGQLIYQMPSDGPLFSCIYGPLSYLAFLPAALMPTVWTTFAAGSLSSTIFLLLPIVLTSYLLSRSRLRLAELLPVLTLGFAAIVCLRPLNYVACHVTADSPAICLMALSILTLYFNQNQPGWKAAACSSAALVFSVGCKQNMLVAAIVVVASAFFFFSRRFLVLYLSFAAVALAAVLGMIAGVYRNLSTIYFNDFVVPSHWPLIRSQFFSGAYHLYESAVVLIVMLAGVGLICFLRGEGAVWNRKLRFSFVFFAAAGALVPSSLSTYAAQGGDVNSFSHAIYFLLLGTILLTLEMMALAQPDTRVILGLRIWSVAVTLALLGSGLPAKYNAEWTHKVRQTPAAVTAYNYCKRNPGQVYFPSNSIGVYLAERKFYDTDWGIMILQIAGQKLRRENVLRYIPQNAQYVAMPRNFEGAGAVLPFVAPHLLRTTVPGLEDFFVFQIER